MYISSTDKEISQSVSKLTSFRSLKLAGANNQLGKSTIPRPAKAAATNTSALLLRNGPLTSSGLKVSLDERRKYHLCGACVPLNKRQLCCKRFNWLQVNLIDVEFG
jgi:hypothetical protein